MFSCLASAQHKLSVYSSIGHGINYWREAKYDTWGDVGIQPLISATIKYNVNKINLQLSAQKYFQKFEERSDFDLPPNAVYLETFNRSSTQLSGYIGFEVYKIKNFSINSSTGICIGHTKKINYLRESSDGISRTGEMPNVDWGNAISLRQKFDFNWNFKKWILGFCIISDSKIKSWNSINTNYPVSNESYFFFSPGFNLGVNIL
jgi:hypothetical protein